MMNALISIPFHQKALALIDHHGKPYVAMRPIVDGMGLAWQTQERKLKNRFGSVITIMVTTGADGKQYKMLCLPLDKLTTWLLTINPKKVNPAAREAVARYQAESEAALWAYWTTGTVKREEIRREMAAVAEEESASFRRGSHAGHKLYMRKLEKQRNQALLCALQAQLPFVWEGMA